MDKTLAVMATIVALVLVAGFVALAVVGIDTAGYVLFVAGPLVTVVVGITLTRQVGTVAGDVAEVRHQTNSMLTGRLDHLDDQLVAAAEDRAEKAGA